MTSTALIEKAPSRKTMTRPSGDQSGSHPPTHDPLQPGAIDVDHVDVPFAPEAIFRPSLDQTDILPSVSRGTSEPSSFAR